MQRANALVIALLLGAAVVIGSVAALKTAQLKGASARPALSAQAIARRNARLDRVQISLRKALARRPPKLPSVPHFPAVSRPAAAPPVVRYVRPAPVVVVQHRTGGEEAEHGEREHEGGGDD
jgi:hypothetical protein